MSARLNLVMAAFAMTALSYGLARFAYGLLLPQIRGDLALSATAAGWIGGAAFATYCLGIILAFLIGNKLSTRVLVTFAGAVATLGMTLVAIAPNGWVLGAAIALAGVSTGLTSPPLASAVAQGIEEADRAKANGFINTGTAIGIIFSGLAGIAAAGAWRGLYALFALIGSAVTLWAHFAMPEGRRHEVAAQFSLGIFLEPSVIRFCICATMMGAASSAIWTFGADIMRDTLSFSNTKIAWGWIVLGAAGLFGSATGHLTTRHGVAFVQRLSLIGIALALIMLSAATKISLLAFASMGLFGATYIVVTGTLLIQGIARFPQRPDIGLGLPFIALAIGQTIGAPVFGAVLDHFGPTPALISFASIACVAMLSNDARSRMPSMGQRLSASKLQARLGSLRSLLAKLC